jgi:sugar phosphate isomerase/epimerase
MFMRLALSTNWNARRHTEGEALVDEILSLGFDALELGYHTTEALAAGIKRRIASGAITVDSVHAYCPVPLSAPHGYPELHLLASEDEDDRAMAKILLGKTLDFAVSMGAHAVVLHAGRLLLKSWFRSYTTGTILELLDDVERDMGNPAFQKKMEKIMACRAKQVGKIFDAFCLALDTLLPRFEQAGVTLCLENLPSVETFPDGREMAMLKDRFTTPALAYWHDMGHGQVREFLGLENHLAIAQSLLPVTGGIHIHDAKPPLEDHLLPGQGTIDWSAFSFFGSANILCVFEPAPETGPIALGIAQRDLRKVWAVGSRQ